MVYVEGMLSLMHFLFFNVHIFVYTYYILDWVYIYIYACIWVNCHMEAFP